MSLKSFAGRSYAGGVGGLFTGRLLAVVRVSFAALVLSLTFVSGASASGQPVWPMVGSDSAHTGRSPFAGPATPVAESWTFANAQNKVISTSPVIAPDGTIYLGYYAQLDALRPNGTLKWSYWAGPGASRAAAVAGDGTVYVGTTEGELHAVRPDGTQKWVFRGSGMFSAPTIASDGTIYVGADAWGVDDIWENGYLYAVKPDGTLKWAFHADRMGTTPAIGQDGTVYVACWDGKLYAIDPSSGAPKWAFDAAGGYQGDIELTSPAVGDDGTIYVGNPKGDLYSIGPDGTQKWVFTVRQASYPQGTQWELSSPAIAQDGTIYVSIGTLGGDWSETIDWNDPSGDVWHEGTGDVSGELCAVSPTGTLKWRFALAGRLFSPPAIDTRGMLYVSIGYLGAHLGLGIPNDEGLYAINPDGTQNWSMITSHYLNEGHDHHYMDTFSPAIASDGTIYVGSWSNTFYAFAGPLPAPTITAFGPSSGPVGTSVAITGTGFTGATEVRFGSAAATGFTVDSATQISAIVPPDAVSGTIVVTTPTGSATSTASFTPTGFADVPQSHRYALAIYDLAKRRIISGYGTGSFGPGDPVVRQQFAKMLDLSLGLTVTEGGATMPFVDVERPANNLYPDDFVAFAYQNHLVEGKDPTHFQPYVEITRAQVMTMIVRAAKGFKTSAATQPPAGWQGTLNASDPTHGANIATAEYNGLLAGIDLAGWNIWGNATRGEVAQIMWNLRQK